MSSLILSFAALNGFLAVALGAFGAHALKNHLDDYLLGVYGTAVQYHFYHTGALLVVGLLAQTQAQAGLLKISAGAFGLGIVLFCGSLYLLALTGVRWLGAVTPLGGLAFLLGWACLGWAAWNLPDA